MNTGHCQNHRKKNQDQYDTAMPFIRAITDLTDIPPWNRRNGGMPVNYLRQVAVRRKQCDMMPEAQNSRARGNSYC
jgi:hypothetical protein